ELESSQMDLIVAGTRDAVMMVEAGAKGLSEALMLEGVRRGQEANQQLIALQEELIAAFGKPKHEVPVDPEADALKAAVEEILGDRVTEVIRTGGLKAEREGALDELRAEVVAKLGEKYDPRKIGGAVESVLKKVVRTAILDDQRRPDGRGLTEIRPITCEVGVLPRTHGTGLFKRGQTQVLSIVTLGSLADIQKLDNLSPEETKRFMHHYNFPPYSTGETKRMGGPGRREIGHGALAERAIFSVIPDVTSFPD